MPDAFGHWCEDGEDFIVPARPTGLFGGEACELEDLFLDGNGIPTERVLHDGRRFVLHYEDIPDTDWTALYGINVTTPLRTVIDIAPDIEQAQLERIVDDCLNRRLFTVEEARARVAELDMLTRPGAQFPRRILPE